MNSYAHQWHELESVHGDLLKCAVFKVLQQVSYDIYRNDTDDPAILECVPRLADLISTRKELESFKPALNALARASGLWNYIDKETAEIPELLLAETVTAAELGGLTFHREQIAALNTLLEGKNLILSAPTSFGKSVLIDALIASGKYSRIAIILPTIALLDEFRRRLKSRFRQSFKLVMHANERAPEGPAIFLGTQERLLNRDDLASLDLTVVDEFYKLDPNRKDERSVTLNAAVYKLIRQSRQFFFLGPNIDGVQVGSDGRWKFEFLRTRFSTVAVDTFDLGDVADKEGELYDQLIDETNWPALVFVSAPKRANELVAEAADRMAVSDASADFANWLAHNVGPNWNLVKAVRYGFGVHHGRIPRAIAAKMVRMFNLGDLPILFCTSTLIEGVNTAAKTVLIYDKKINRSNYDFFTFSNIRGRAGRLGQHHVGKVFVFNAAPAHEEMEVAPTLFGNEDDAPDDYIVQLEERTRPAQDKRMHMLRQQLALSDQELRVAASIGLDSAQQLKAAVEADLRNGKALRWTGYPRYHEVQAALEAACRARGASSFGAVSTSQLTLLVHRLRSAPSLRAFLRQYDASYRGDPHNYDNVFKFLRACEYGLTQHLAVVEMFVRQADPSTSYSLFLEGLSRWFLPEDLKNLDEEGVPIQISERFWRRDDDREAVVRRLRKAAIEETSSLSAFERNWIRSALDIELDSGDTPPAGLPGASAA